MTRGGNRAVVGALAVACAVVMGFARWSVAQTSQPAAHETVDLWPSGKMPGHGAASAEHELPDRGDHVHRITDTSRPTLMLFPAPGDAPAPAMIVCPGGGYSYVVYDKEGTDIAAWLNRQGISALVLKYRTPHNREGALQDVQRALSLARARAAAFLKIRTSSGRNSRDPRNLGFATSPTTASKRGSRSGIRSIRHATPQAISPRGPTARPWCRRRNPRARSAGVGCLRAGCHSRFSGNDTPTASPRYVLRRQPNRLAPFFVGDRRQTL